MWDARERNPWALIPSTALLELGHAEPPDPNAPGPFALAEDGRLAELLDDAGFTDVEVVPVNLERHYATRAGHRRRERQLLAQLRRQVRAS